MQQVQGKAVVSSTAVGDATKDKLLTMHVTDAAYLELDPGKDNNKGKYDSDIGSRVAFHMGAHRRRGATRWPGGGATMELAARVS